MKKKFNDEVEFNDWVYRNMDDEPIIPEYGEMPEPNEYPCIMIYEFIDNPCLDNGDEEDIYDELKEQGYDDEDIQKLCYEFVYPSDFK